MRILVISPIFPPWADAEANCAGKFVQALLDFGIEVSVIFSSNARTPARWDRSRMWKSLEHISIDIVGATGVPAVERCWYVLQYQSTSWSRWTHDVVEKAKELHRQNAFDLIISRALPRHAHLAGYWVAKTLKIPWIAFSNDPWDFSPFIAIREKQPEWSPGLNWRIWWQRIVARADRMCFPCERLRDLCVKNSNHRSGIMIVPHIGGVAEAPRLSSEFLILHAGKLGLQELTGRSSLPLLEGLSQLFRLRPGAKSRTRLLFVGPEDEETAKRVESLGLREQVASSGIVSYEESLQHIARAVLCVLVEGDVEEGVFLPSKLCDYLAARKPVLALSPGVGTVADLASQGGIRQVSPNDCAGVGTALVESFDAFLASRLDAYAPPPALVRRFEARTVIQDFLASIKPLTRQSAGCGLPEAQVGASDDSPDGGRSEGYPVGV